MSVDTRDIELRIWNEVDSGETERCVIHLERGQNLCAVLESKRALVWWENVYSINVGLSPPLNWRPREHEPAQTRFMVNHWGECLFDTLTREHRLKLQCQMPEVRAVPVVRAGGGARRGVPTPGWPRGH